MNEGPPEAWCWERLRSLRWPVHVVCPRCHQRARRRYRRRYVQYYRCSRCTRMFSDRTKTPFERSTLPLAIWFRAVAWLLMGETSTTRGLARALGVERKTARTIKQRLSEIQSDPLLRSIGTSVFCWRPDRGGVDGNGK